jgi:hypothetical protein
LPFGAAVDAESALDDGVIWQDMWAGGGLWTRVRRCSHRRFGIEEEPR